MGGGQRPGSDRGDQRAELARSWLERLVSRVALIDVSPAALDRTRHAVAMLGRVPVTCFEMTYGEGLEAAAGDGQLAPPRLVLFLGSNIGNFDPAEAALFLAHARRSLAPDDRLLLGVDLVKPVAALLDAYDDPLGVTAAFNKNLLARANRELGTNFDLRAFAHRASWNARHSRVEMHLVSLRRQAVHVPGSCTIVLDEGELIWTESSYKYTEEGIDELAQQAGLRIEQKWVDRQAGFELALLGRQ